MIMVTVTFLDGKQWLSIFRLDSRSQLQLCLIIQIETCGCIALWVLLLLLPVSLFIEMCISSVEQQ